MELFFGISPLWKSFLISTHPLWMSKPFILKDFAGFPQFFAPYDYYDIFNLPLS